MARYVSYRDFDWMLMAFVLIICGMGVMEIHSATCTRSSPEPMSSRSIGSSPA